LSKDAMTDPGVDEPAGPSRPESRLRASDLSEASGMLRAVLTAVEAGELEAGSSRARALVRRIEGAAAALDAAAQTTAPPPKE